MTVPAATQRNVAEADADVIVVGAGPAGSTTAFHLAQAGLDVLLLEKTTFPREKVCGDGLTPRAVKQLVGMGVDIDAPGWVRNKGLRVIGGGAAPRAGLARAGAATPTSGWSAPARTSTRSSPRRGAAPGARLLRGRHRHRPGPRRPQRPDRRRDRQDDGGEVTYRARLVVAADGNSTRLSLGMGLRKRDDRPMGVAVRTYYTSPRHDDDYLETWLELWDGDTLLPGYGWIFGVGDGTVQRRAWAC